MKFGLLRFNPWGWELGRVPCPRCRRRAVDEAVALVVASSDRGKGFRVVDRRL
jgi:hypothetical protein